jgi:predicted MPP superfamily phosphohydrolase
VRLRRLLRWRLAGWLALAALPLAVWAFWLEPASLVVRETRLDLPAWPVECGGLRVALLADLHVGSPFNGRGKLDEIVRRTQAARPDLILLGGDYVIQGVPGGRFVPPEETAAALGRLKAPLGVWAVLGNHDWWLDAPRVRTALETAGIPVLEDQSRELTRGACHFWLAGISDLWEGRHDVPGTLAGVPPGVPVLVLTHNPDIFVDIPPRVTLTLAGHTHGGQVWLPVLGRPIVPSRYKQRFAIGHIVEQGRHLFVSPGLGTSILPVRFLVPPEISVVRLRASGS